MVGHFYSSLFFKSKGLKKQKLTLKNTQPYYTTSSSINLYLLMQDVNRNMYSYVRLCLTTECLTKGTIKETGAKGMPRNNQICNSN